MEDGGRKGEQGNQRYIRMTLPAICPNVNQVKNYRNLYQVRLALGTFPISYR